jgi:acyl carrier protein
LVATPYSKDYQGAVPALSPQEVAEAVVHAATAKQAQGSAVVVDISGTQRGQFGFHVQTNTPSIGASSSRHDASPLTAGPSGHVSNSEISSIVRKKLGVPADFDLTQAGLGTISSWDSLRHIELILELEMRLGVHFTSSEIESCRTYAQLEKLCLDKLGT